MKPYTNQFNGFHLILMMGVYVTLFVQNILVDATSRAMVRAIFDIAVVMQIRSIAEFVENDDLRNALQEIGIDFVQGFGVAMPVPLSEYDFVELAA